MPPRNTNPRSTAQTKATRCCDSDVMPNPIWPIVLVVDNVPFHKVAGVEDAIQAVGESQPHAASQVPGASVSSSYLCGADPAAPAAEENDKKRPIQALLHPLARADHRPFARSDQTGCWARAIARDHNCGRCCGTSASRS
jgi:hypothetical protein